MSEQDRNQNLGNISENANKLVISDKQHQIIVIVNNLSGILVIILTGFIIEALINQHPVFEFLHFTAFDQNSIILGSITLAVPLLVLLFYIIATGSLMLNNFRFNKNISILCLIGIILIITWFIMTWKIYTNSLSFYSYFITTTGSFIYAINEISKKAFYEFYDYKLIETISFFLIFSGIFLLALKY
jgi:hypothetical protein